MTNENAFARGEWKDGQFYPYKSQFDMGSTTAEQAARQQAASDWQADEGTVDELPARPRRTIPPADRELLELAARALGAVRVEDIEGEEYLILHFADGSVANGWNPLMHGDDALALSVTLSIDIGRGTGNSRWAVFYAGSKVFTESGERNGKQDAMAATRRAITRAAAEIGKAAK